MANREDALKEVIQKKPELVKLMIECPEPKKLVLLLHDNGIDVTETEASKIMRAINFYTVTSDVGDNKKSDEPKKLDDKALESTSGGSIGAFLYWGKFLYDMYYDYQSAKKSKDKFSDTVNKWKNNIFWHKKGERRLINALEFKNAVISGANNILKHKNHLNELNIFPVPDGDTGSNMCMTIMGVSEVLSKQEFKTVSEVADAISHTALRCSRGNSGVILSIILRGFSKNLKGKTEIRSCDLIQSLEVGVKDAYESVSNPVEGTMLTVARVAAEYGRASFKSGKSFVEILEQICHGARDALNDTPNLLPVLKKAHVVDAGGKGLCLILEGILSFVKNGVIVSTDLSSLSFEEDNKFESEVKKFDDDIRFTYCTELIIAKNVDKFFDANVLTKSLQKIGDCVIVMHDEEVIKTHVHTNFPDKVLSNALVYGKLINVKIDNLEEQNKKLIDKSSVSFSQEENSLEPSKQFGILSIARGDGIINLFKEIGCDEVLEGGQSLNPSAEQISNAVLRVPAKTVYVLPNNKNIIMSAEQATEYVTDRDIVIIPTRTIPQGISAVLSFDSNSSCEENIKNMTESISRVKTGHVTYAARDSEFGGFKIKRGDVISLIDGKLKVVDTDKIRATERILQMMCDKNSSFVSLIFGMDVTYSEAERLKNFIENKFGDIEISIIDGKSSMYYFIISVE